MRRSDPSPRRRARGIVALMQDVAPRLARVVSTFAVAALAALAPAALGCGPARSPYMAPAPHTSVTGAPDMATVVFLRPSYYSSSTKVTVVDGKGRFLGESVPESYFAARLPAGEHLLVGYVDTVAPLRANLRAGQIYFVEVAAEEGPFSPRMQLLAVTPRTASWGRLDAWMEKSAAYSPDEPGGQAAIEAKKGSVLGNIAKAERILAGYDAAELAARTITPDDGK